MCTFGRPYKIPGLEPDTVHILLSEMKSLFLNFLINLNSTFELFHREISFLLDYFKTNNFPLNIVYKQIKSFLNKLYEPKELQIIVPKKRLYIKFPYFGYISEKIKDDINKLLTKYFSHLDLRLCFVNSFQIGSFFNHKDRLDDDMCSSIIYLFTCEECNSQYIGSSIRQLRCRVAEHMHLSPRSKLPILSPNFSSIMEHHKETKHSLSPNNFKILCNSNKSDIRLLESIYIHKLKPKLNNNTPCELNIV